MILLWPPNCWNKGTWSLLPSRIKHRKPCNGVPVAGLVTLSWESGALGMPGGLYYPAALWSPSSCHNLQWRYRKELTPRSFCSSNIACCVEGLLPFYMDFTKGGGSGKTGKRKIQGKTHKGRVERKFTLSLPVLSSFHKYVIPTCLLSG